MSIELRKGQSPAAHFVMIGPVSLFFSYETCVAFAVNRWGWVISENVWSVTTGKHIGQNLPHKDLVPRTPYGLFEKMLAVVEESIQIGDFEAIVMGLDALKEQQAVKEPVG